VRERVRERGDDGGKKRRRGMGDDGDDW